MYYEQREEWSYKKNIDTIKISDLGRRKSEKTGVVGITPFYDEALEDGFLEPTMYDQDITKPRAGSWQLFSQSGNENKFSLAEQLYSAKGSQSAGVSEYVRKQLQLDWKSQTSFLLQTYSKKWGNFFYEL